VDDIPIDFDEATYGLAVQSAGGIDNLYYRYFDR
jgi:hypothetical protein